MVPLYLCRLLLTLTLRRRQPPDASSQRFSSSLLLAPSPRTHSRHVHACGALSSSGLSARKPSNGRQTGEIKACYERKCLLVLCERRCDRLHSSRSIVARAFLPSSSLSPAYCLRVQKSRQLPPNKRLVPIFAALTLLPPPGRPSHPIHSQAATLLSATPHSILSIFHRFHTSTRTSVRPCVSAPGDSQCRFSTPRSPSFGPSLNIITLHTTPKPALHASLHSHPESSFRPSLEPCRRIAAILRLPSSAGLSFATSCPVRQRALPTPEVSTLAPTARPPSPQLPHLTRRILRIPNSIAGQAPNRASLGRNRNPGTGTLSWAFRPILAIHHPNDPACASPSPTQI